LAKFAFVIGVQQKTQKARERLDICQGGTRKNNSIAEKKHRHKENPARWRVFFCGSNDRKGSKRALDKTFLKPEFERLELGA
jgi:hypothetical protein